MMFCYWKIAFPGRLFLLNSYTNEVIDSARLLAAHIITLVEMSKIQRILKYIVHMFLKKLGVNICIAIQPIILSLMHQSSCLIKTEM